MHLAERVWAAYPESQASASLCDRWWCLVSFSSYSIEQLLDLRGV